MTSAHTEFLPHSGATGHSSRDKGRTVGRGSLLRLVVGGLAIVALVALGALDARRPTPDQAASDAASLAKPDFAPAVGYEGRGKWGGY